MILPAIDMRTDYFLTICLNPVLQKTIVLPSLKENRVNRSREYYFDASGKGVNVSRVLVQSGEKICHLTQAGGRNRDLFLSMLKTAHIPVTWTDSGSEIRCCYTLCNRENHTSTEIVEEAVPVGPGTEEKIRELYAELLPHSHTVIISGTKAAGFSGTLFPDMVKLAKESGKRVVLDYRGDDLRASLAYSPDIIKPNIREFTAAFFPGHEDIPDIARDTIVKKIKEKMLSLWGDFRIHTILTSGSGPVLFVEKGKINTITPPGITPLNTIGCGDAFTAGCARGLHSTGDISLAVQQGIECATKNAMIIRPGYIKDMEKNDENN
jgi:fructose-1-phosphate kinase PfkB-like protein